ncbi:MAG: type II toxin-antitoxin system RelE/ParE family toxin [Alphaproteobacteria bacterium]|nr:type II toxin-antitoxin system RelE/ParE family toxin [Alphaproteobacteria bacterium]
MVHEVYFRPHAEADLIAIQRYIAHVAGHGIADRYAGRIARACLGLARFPDRGRMRDDIYPGLRTTSFEKRTTIAYIVTDDRVVIVGIYYGGRDYERFLFGDASREP